METVKLIVLFAFAGIGIAVFLFPAVAKLLVKFYNMGKKKKKEIKGIKYEIAKRSKR